MTRRNGFSLIEALISMALLTLLLAIGAAILSSTANAHRTTATVVDAQERLDAATQVLRYDLRMAGYRGTDGATDLLGNGARFSAVTDGSGRLTGDLTVRYTEDRYGDGTEQRAITYALSDGTLTRQVTIGSDVSDAVAFLTGVTSINVDTPTGGAALDLSLSDGTTLSVVAAFVQPLGADE